MSKKELLEEARRLANLHKSKKDLIYNIMKDLDQGNKSSQMYIGGMAKINDTLKEMKELEEQYEKVYLEIKQ
jgi:succinate dehydrogenase/fumarate reductase flavoprotein subunit